MEVQHKLGLEFRGSQWVCGMVYVSNCIVFKMDIFYTKWAITENKSNLLKNLHKLENIKIPGVK